jgi:hypothetical protein
VVVRGLLEETTRSLEVLDDLFIGVEDVFAREVCDQVVELALLVDRDVSRNAGSQTDSLVVFTVGGSLVNDAGAIINRVYDRMNEYKKVETSVKDLISRGEKARALELVETRGNEFVAAQVGDTFTKTMGNLTKLENAVRASDMTPAQKREKLDDIRQAKIKYAKMVEQASDKSKLP